MMAFVRRSPGPDLQLDHGLVPELELMIHYAEAQALHTDRVRTASLSQHAILNELFHTAQSNPSKVIGLLKIEPIPAQKGSDCLLQALYHDPRLPIREHLTYEKFLQRTQAHFNDPTLGISPLRNGRGLTETEALELLNTLGLQNATRVPLTNENQLLRLLQTNGSVLADLEYRAQSGHAVVIEAAFQRVNGRSGNPEWIYLVRDSTMSGEPFKGITHYSYEELSKLITSTRGGILIYELPSLEAIRARVVRL